MLGVVKADGEGFVEGLLAHPAPGLRRVPRVHLQSGLCGALP